MSDIYDFNKAFELNIPDKFLGDNELLISNQIIPNKDDSKTIINDKHINEFCSINII